MSQLELKRGSPMTFVPVPSSVLAGDYVFTSTIYPIDDAGHAILVDDLLGEVGTSIIEAQTAHCLETLSRILKEMKSDLDRVLKVHVQLVDPTDFYEFKLAWRRY